MTIDDEESGLKVPSRLIIELYILFAKGDLFLLDHLKGSAGAFRDSRVEYEIFVSEWSNYSYFDWEELISFYNKYSNKPQKQFNKIKFNEK